MIKKIYLALTILLLITSCKGVDPVAWDQEIVNNYNLAINGIADFEELISLEKVGDPDAIKNVLTQGTATLNQLDLAITSVNEKEIPKGGEEYKDAILEVFESMKEQISVGLKFTNITNENAEAEIEKYAEKYDSASSTTAKKVNSFTRIQEEFMKEKGIN